MYSTATVSLFSPTIEGIRVIRDSTPNQYMALVNFKDEMSASSFYTDVNGRPYNSFEDQVSHFWSLISVFTNPHDRNATWHSCPMLKQ